MIRSLGIDGHAILVMAGRLLPITVPDGRAGPLNAGRIQPRMRIILHDDVFDVVAVDEQRSRVRLRLRRVCDGRRSSSTCKRDDVVLLVDDFDTEVDDDATALDSD